MGNPTSVDGWDEAEKRNKEAAGGKYCSFKKAGDSVTGIVLDKAHTGNELDQPNSRQLVYDEKNETYDEYDPAVHGKDAKTSTRYKFNFCQLAENGAPHEPKMKILELSNPDFTNALTAKGKYGLNTIFEVKQSGEKGDTKRVKHFLPEIKMVITDAIKDFIAKTPHHNLKDDNASDARATNGAGTHGSANGSGTTSPGADPVISTDQCNAVVGRVKALHAADPKITEAFMAYAAKTFGTSKIREFKTSHLALASAWLTEREPKTAPTAAEAPAANPWD
jgi:hypothetical protein